MPDAVVIHDVPQTGGIPTAVAAEDHLVVRRGEAARRQATREGGHWLNTVVQRAGGAARAAAPRADRGEDAVG